MKPRNAEGARLETDYLNRVREALHGRETSEVEEVCLVPHCGNTR